MKKNLILIAVIFAVVTSTLSIVAVFAQSAAQYFPDVDDNAYYAAGVLKMRNLGVVTGYENGNFGPNDYVTRGQLVTMLEKYDRALLNSPGQSASGIYDLHQVVCLGGLDFNIQSKGIQEAYDRLCDFLK